MSSLQKFHRRTNNAAAAGPLFSTVGSGSDTVGYRLGLASGSSAYLIVAPKSTEGTSAWGSVGTTRGVTSTTNGALNTGTLYGFGSAAHPAAYYAKSLTTGGYNSWYLPAKDELLTLYSNKSATPFSGTSAKFSNNAVYWSSTEYGPSPVNNAYGMYLAGSYATGTAFSPNKSTDFMFRAVRQYYAPATIGDGSATTGYWLGTAGDGVSKLIAAPKSTEVQTAWGSQGTVRNTTSITNGVANTNTLYGFGNSITTGHPAAYYAKTLTTGGYNAWYLPAKNELMTMYSNNSATPFATADAIGANLYWSSTEHNGTYAWGQQGADPTTGGYKSYPLAFARAIRRSTI